MTADGRHRCTEDLPQDGAGPAITECEEDVNGVYWVGNDEYGTAVRFCPYCCAQAPVDPANVPRTSALRKAAAVADAGAATVSWAKRET